MAKVFGGFTPEQMGKIVPEMAGMQADEQQAYIMSQPGAAKRVGKMAEVAMRQLGAKAMPGMAEGGYVKGYAIGGTVKPDEEGKTEAVVNSTPDNIAGLVEKSIQDPTSMTTKTEVETMSDADKASGTIAAGTGEQGVTTDATATTAEAGTPVTAPTKTEAATVDPTKATPAVTEATESLDAAVGKVSEGAKVEAASQDP